MPGCLGNMAVLLIFWFETAFSWGQILRNLTFSKFLSLPWTKKSQIFTTKLWLYFIVVNPLTNCNVLLILTLFNQQCMLFLQFSKINFILIPIKNLRDIKDWSFSVGFSKDSCCSFYWVKFWFWSCGFCCLGSWVWWVTFFSAIFQQRRRGLRKI